MNRKKNKNNKYLILGAIVFALIATAAYALFTDTLDVSGNLSASAEFNLEYTATSTSSVAASSTISTDKKTLTVNANLSAPGEEVTISYTITNNGTLSATLKDIVSNHNNNADLEVDLVNANLLADTVLAPGDSTNGYIVVRWKATSTNENPTSVTFDVTFNFDQTV